MVGNGKPKLLAIAMKMSNGGGVTSLTRWEKKNHLIYHLKEGGNMKECIILHFERSRTQAFPSLVVNSDDT
jgi:hypothetical protein